MNHKDSGIKRRVSEAVYPKDILSEITLVMAPPDVKGAWAWCLLAMWDNDTDRVEGSYLEIGLFWGCSADEAKRLCEEIKRRKIGGVTLSHDYVTLMSRRLNRRLKEREQAKKRKRKERQNKCHASVTGENGTSSSSSSISSSSSVTNKSLGIATDDFEIFWQAYPLQIAKQPAMVAWVNSADRPPISTLLEILNTQKQSERWKESGGKFIPAPAKWLIECRWNDVVSKKKSTTKSIILNPERSQA